MTYRDIGPRGEATDVLDVFDVYTENYWNRKSKGKLRSEEWCLDEFPGGLFSRECVKALDAMENDAEQQREALKGWISRTLAKQLTEAG